MEGSLSNRRVVVLTRPREPSRGARGQGCSAVSVPPPRVPHERRSPRPKAISKQHTVQNGPMTTEVVTWHDMSVICASSLFAHSGN